MVAIRPTQAMDPISIRRASERSASGEVEDLWLSMTDVTDSGDHFA